MYKWKAGSSSQAVGSAAASLQLPPAGSLLAVAVVLILILLVFLAVRPLLLCRRPAGHSCRPVHCCLALAVIGQQLSLLLLVSHPCGELVPDGLPIPLLHSAQHGEQLVSNLPAASVGSICRGREGEAAGECTGSRWVNE